MKYKNLTKNQILISLDRLTRFKATREKYLRVFLDVLSNCLLEPKMKKNELEQLDYSVIVDYVNEIFNSSLKKLVLNFNNKTSNRINNFIREYENSVFSNDDETQTLLNNNIDYINAIKLIDESSPINLKWLKEINKFEDLNSITKLREEKLLKYPIAEVLLVEGITEEILLPAFSRHLGYDFYAKGIQVIPAGGKNQVVKMYYKLSQELKLPIFVLLDKDAEENIAQIKPKLRDIDKIHIVSCGEFEDLLSKSLIVKTINSHFENFLTINEDELISELSTAKKLEELFKTKGLHEFKKAEFAKLVRENIKENSDISDEIKAIITEITLTNKNA